MQQRCYKLDLTTTVLTAREFNQDTGRAKRAARAGPVVITDRGEPAHVLLTIDQDNALVGRFPSIVDLLGLEEAARIPFRPRRLGRVTRSPDLE